MIKLNLISPDQQSYLKIKEIFTIIENFLGLMVIATIVIAIILIPVRNSLLILDEQLNNEREEILAKNKLQTDKISNFNKKVEVLDLIQKSTYNWPKLLAGLAEIVPADVSLTQFNSQLQDKHFILQGYAKTRDSYLVFKDNLFKSSLFYNLETPLSDILKKDDITFEIKGYFN